MIKIKDVSRLKAFGFEELGEGFYSKVLVDEERDKFNVKHTITILVGQNKKITVVHEWKKDLKDKMEQEHNRHYGHLEHNYINGYSTIPLDDIFELQAAGLLIKVSDDEQN